MRNKPRRIVRNWCLGILALSAVLVSVAGGNPTAGVKGGPGQAAETWRIAEGVTYENLAVFPVLASHPADTSVFLTLDEALASGEAVVTEQGNEILRRSRSPRPVFLPQSGPSVNQLVLTNRSSKPLLLLAGEIVSGGKQDRIIAKDRIVPPGADPLPLDVFCVEHGRWTTGSAQFSAARMMVHPSVREKAAVDHDQGQVWAAVRSGTTASAAVGASGGAVAAAPPISERTLATVVATEAPSESYKKIYESSAVGASIEGFAEQIERRFARATSGLKGEHVVGVVVAYGSEVAWSDVFASPQLFDRYWKKLLRSYVVEALARAGTREQASLEDARDFLRRSGGHEREETEPDVYVWRERSAGRYAEIELEALSPKQLTLHWLKVLRTS
jgi:hypothetical protein